MRHIDWNVTARSLEPHVWRPRAEHELEAWVLVDETASMAFGTTTSRRATSPPPPHAGMLVDGRGTAPGSPDSVPTACGGRPRLANSGAASRPFRG